MMQLRLDPRTKLLLLLEVILMATFSPSLIYELGVVIMIMFLGIVGGKPKQAIGLMLGYLLIILMTVWTKNALSDEMKTMLLAFIGLIHKVYPCSMIATFIISTTKVGEFLAAMAKAHIPKNIVIPLAVMLRYLPTVREDWRFIKDAMSMRDVSPNLKGLVRNFGMTVECVYVPLLMVASKTADELTVAAITRGIENPKPRTSLIQIHFGIVDYLTILIGLLYLGYGFYLRGGM